MLEAKVVRKLIRKFCTAYTINGGLDHHKSILQVCQDIIDYLTGEADRPPYWSMLEFLKECSWKEIRFYVSIIYSVLMGNDRRKLLAAYFTPPHIAEYTVSKLIECGFDPVHDTVLDPASGGAAFISPVARVMADACLQSGMNVQDTLFSVERRLFGLEVDEGLARLCKRLLFFELLEELKAGGPINPSIIVGDALRFSPPPGKFDLIIGNPPYGRTHLESIPESLAIVVVDKYVNRYAAFLKLAVDWVRLDGLVGLVIPTSFIGGPYYRKLRKFLTKSTEVLRIDLVDKRDDLFFDAIQDICVLIMRKKDGGQPRCMGYKGPQVALLKTDGNRGSVREIGTADIPDLPCEDEWSVPHGNGASLVAPASSVSLKDYGYLAKVGAFVWNREKEKLREGSEPMDGEYPLLWASSVRPDGTFSLHGKSGPECLSFVAIAKASSSTIIRHSAVIVQRTSNKMQQRRLNAAVVPQWLVDRYDGFVCENHVIVIYPEIDNPEVSPEELSQIINSNCIDNLFRQVSGTVSVSVTILGRLPLPEPKALRNALKASKSFDEAIQRAFINDL
jgi:adenine-specific DNA-methyltransferase